MLTANMATATAAPSSSSSSEEFKRVDPEEYFRQHIAQGLRTDGRTTLSALRPVSLSAGSISTADGSAIVKQGNTVVTCGVKLELAKPKAERPDEGFVVANVELPSLCHSRYKPGPPPEQAQVASQFLNDVINNSSLIDLNSLCIKEGKLGWVVNVDVVCLNYDGNLLDVSLKALLAALKTTQLPKIHIEEEDALKVDDEDSPPSTTVGGHGVLTEDENRKNIKVFPEESAPLSLSCHPVSCTTAIFEGQSLLDPTDEEEEMSSALVTVVLDHDSGDLVHLRKAGGEAITREQLQECTAEAKKQAKKIKKMVDKATSLKGW